MFRFNFQVEAEDESKEQESTSQPLQLTLTEKENVPCKAEPFREHTITGNTEKNTDQPEKPVQTELFENQSGDPIIVQYVDSRAVAEDLSKSENGVGLVKVTKDTDLVTGVYEGGLKIWECSIDLASFVASDVNVKNCSVIELGCGAGLPGIVAVLNGASRTDFQDYNDQVIDHITIPNVSLNCSSSNFNARFFSGDWKKLEEQFRTGGKSVYDVILTSETIYNIDNYDKLISLFDACLKPDGKIYLSAKIHYFGVGGGLRVFEQALEKTKAWKFSTVRTFDEGVAREILEISRTGQLQA